MLSWIAIECNKLFPNLCVREYFLCTFFVYFINILIVTDFMDVTNDRNKNIGGIDMSRLFNQSPVKYCYQ